MLENTKQKTPGELAIENRDYERKDLGLETVLKSTNVDVSRRFLVPSLHSSSARSNMSNFFTRKTPLKAYVSYTSSQ